MGTVDSQQVSWWSVREFVTSCLDEAGVESFPLVGTPAWCALPADDERKIASLFDAAQHWALRLETWQLERTDASRELRQAADWSAADRYVANHKAFYAARPWMKRVSA
jgi:hypothetical protein